MQLDYLRQRKVDLVRHFIQIERKLLVITDRDFYRTTGRTFEPEMPISDGSVNLRSHPFEYAVRVGSGCHRPDWIVKQGDRRVRRCQFSYPRQFGAAKEIEITKDLINGAIRRVRERFANVQEYRGIAKR